jgi:hypothetical protein
LRYELAFDKAWKWGGDKKVDKRFPYGGLAKLCSLLLAPVVALTLAALGVANAAGQHHKDAELHNGYGCMGVVEAGILTEIFEVVPDGKGNIKSGRAILNSAGDVCTFTVDPAGSSYQVRSDGTALMTIKLIGAAGADADDATLCAAFNNTSEHFVMVVEQSGQRLDFSGNDDFFSGGSFTGTDTGDFILEGSCHRQVGATS